jgi:virulence factor Mce-like protein
MRTRFNERPASQQRGWVFLALVGTVGVLAILGLSYVGFRSPDAIPGRGYYTVNAEFSKADNLSGHDQVRMGGKLVGQVLNPHVVNGKAVVELQLEPTVRPLRSDSRITVRPRSAVGVRYVDIDPGRSGAPLAEGGTIPASQTSATIQLDEVLGTFDTKTRRRTQQFLRELGTGFAGRGDDLNETIGAAPQTLAGIDSVLGAVADRTGSVGALIGGGSTLAGAADPVREAIAQGFAPEAKALRPFTQERDAVHATLEKAPGALATVSALLPQVDPMVDQLRGLARDARPALRAAPGAVRQTSALLQEARPGLRAAESTLRVAAKVVDPTLNLLDDVRPVLPQFDGTLVNLAPLVGSLGAYSCDIIKFGDQWGSEMSYGNQDGGVLRFNLQFGPESVFGFTEKTLGTRYTNAYPEPCVAGTEKVGG